MPGHDDCAKVIEGRVPTISTVNNATSRALRGGSVTAGCLTVEANTDLQLIDSLMSFLLGPIFDVLDINLCNQETLFHEAIRCLGYRALATVMSDPFTPVACVDNLGLPLPRNSDWAQLTLNSE